MAVDDAPEIDEGHDWIWRCWWRLHQGSRPSEVSGIAAPLGVTMIRSVPGCLPWTAVVAWAERNGLGQSDEEFLDRCIQEMDQEFLKWWWEENNKPR